MDRKRLFTIFAIIFTNIFGAMMILPVLALYAENRFGATVFQAALLATAYFGAQFLAAPYLGRLSDRYGRRPLLLISQFGTVLSFIMFIFAEELGIMLDGIAPQVIRNGGLVAMFAARILDGITGGNITIAQAYVSDVSTPETRTQSLGMLTAAFGVGFIFGPAIGGLLAKLGVKAPFIGATIVTILTLLLTFILLEESLPPEKRSTASSRKERMPLRQAIQNRNFAFLLVLGFIQALAFSAMPATFSLYAEKVLFHDSANIQEVTSKVGLMLTYVGLVTVITQTWLLKPIVRRFGETNMLVIGMVSLFIALFTIPLFANAIIVALLFTPSSFGRGMLEPSLQSLVASEATPQTRGRYLGLYQSVLSLALIFGPIWAGWVFNNIRPQAVFQVAALIIVPGIILAVIFRARKLQAAEAAI